MNFEQTHERRMLAQSISRHVAQRYGEPAKRLVPQAPGVHDRTHWNVFAEIGAVGALFDEAHGGLGGTPFDLMAVFEEIGRGLVTEPFLPVLMAGRALASDGSGAHGPWLDKIVEGSALASLAHCEPEGQWHPTQVGCSAHRRGDDWVLSGTKAGVPWGDQADVLVVSARTSGGWSDEEGISLFLLPAGMAGVELRDCPQLDGGRAAELVMREVRVPGSALIGAPGAAAGVLRDAIGDGVLAICAEALGAMEVVMAGTLDYLKTRKQFGSPLGAFQALQHRMVDLMLLAEQSRSATFNCAVHRGADRATRERCVAAAKYTVGSAALRLSQECIQLHGGIGMTWELPLSHYARRLALMNFQLGDEDSHLARYIAARAA